MNPASSLDTITNNINKEHKESLQALGNEEGIELTKEQIILIHDNAINQYGGSFGTRDENLLDSVSKGPYQAVFGENLYPTPFDKAAKYLFDFAKYQIFIDGNKRTGYNTCLVFLKANNIELTLNAEELYNLTMAIANNKINEVADVSKILEQNAIFKFGNTQIPIESEEEDYGIEQ